MQRVDGTLIYSATDLNNYLECKRLTDLEALVLRGGPGKTVACAACHGEGLKGMGEVPRLAGIQPLYLARQLFDMRHGRSAGKAAELMKPVVANLTNADMMAIAAYTASK